MAIIFGDQFMIERFIFEIYDIFIKETNHFKVIHSDD